MHKISIKSIFLYIAYLLRDSEREKKDM
jgi:hypothetical protein